MMERKSRFLMVEILSHNSPRRGKSSYEGHEAAFATL